MPTHPSSISRLLTSCLALAAPILLSGCGGDRQDSQPQTFQVRRGDMNITITETGSLEAAESAEISSKVSRSVRIVEMIEEGTRLTEADVAQGRILVKLDATELEEQLQSRLSSLDSAVASLTEAQEALAIQKSQNESNIRSAELNVTFAVNRLNKLIGEKLAQRYADGKPEVITALLEDAELGGETLQKLRKLHSDIELEREELSRAQTKLKWTARLHERGFVTAEEKEADALALRRRELSLRNAEDTLDLYRRYEFLESFEKAWSEVFEARETLEREQAMARSRVAQADARYKSKVAAHQRETENVNNTQRDIESCTIRATKPGLVVYKVQGRWQNQGPLSEGSEIRPKQTILEIPDIANMVLKVDIHEALIDLVSPGLTAAIKIDAFADQVFEGRVVAKAILPSSQNRWLNPDLKVYTTTVAINANAMGLRPGMTGTVEILVEKLKDVLHVPIQAVQTDRDGRRYCYRQDGSKAEVAIGKRNQIFVQITEGLAEGDMVLMTPPKVQ